MYIIKIMKNGHKKCMPHKPIDENRHDLMPEIQFDIKDKVKKKMKHNDIFTDDKNMNKKKCPKGHKVCKCKVKKNKTKK